MERLALMSWRLVAIFLCTARWDGWGRSGWKRESSLTSYWWHQCHGSLTKVLQARKWFAQLSVFRLSSWRGFWFLWSTRVEFKLRKWVRLPLAGATEVLLANCTQCGSRSSRYDRHNQGEDNNTDPCVVDKFLQAMGPLPTFGDMHLVAGSPPSSFWPCTLTYYHVRFKAWNRFWQTSKMIEN